MWTPITIGVNIICGGSIEKQNERVAFEQMTLDIGVAKLRWEYVSLVWTKFCLQQRKNSFLLAFIEILQNCSYKSSFCTSNLWPVICFPLSTALLHSSLFTRACASIVFFSILLKSMATVNCSFWTFFKIIFFLFNRKKEIHTALEQLEVW